MYRLSSFMVLNLNGGDRVTFTYDEIDENTGEPISTNNKRNFYVVDSGLQADIDSIRSFIYNNKLSD